MIFRIEKNEYIKLLDLWVDEVEKSGYVLSEGDYEFYKTHVPIYLNHLDMYAYKDDTNEIKGFIGISEDKIIDRFFVHYTVRGTGIGELLMDYAINELDVTKVDVNEKNQHFLDFYYKLGFIEIGREEFDGENLESSIVHLEKKK